MIQTSYRHFMGNTICDTAINLIPPHTPLRREIASICPSNCLIYGVKNLRVLRATLCSFFRLDVTCGGLGMSNHPSLLKWCNNPHDIKKEILWLH